MLPFPARRRLGERVYVLSAALGGFGEIIGVVRGPGYVTVRVRYERGGEATVDACLAIPLAGRATA